MLVGLTVPKFLLKAKLTIFSRCLEFCLHIIVSTVLQRCMVWKSIHLITKTSHITKRVQKMKTLNLMPCRPSGPGHLCSPQIQQSWSMKRDREKESLESAGVQTPLQWVTWSPAPNVLHPGIGEVKITLVHVRHKLNMKVWHSS